MNLTGVREEYASLIRAVASNDVSVIDNLPDSISPPAVLIAWGDPWLVPGTFCAYTAQVEIMVVAQRIEPGGQYARIEFIVGEILDALKTVSAGIRDVTSPYPMQLGGVDYLSASINVVHDMENE